MQDHPNAHGMRNKPFPYLEDLTNIFERDRATEMGAEAPTDVVEEIDIEEQQFPHTPPAINESQEEENIYVSQSFMVHTPQMTTNTKATGPSWPTKTKKTRHETIEIVRELTYEMTRIENLMATVGEHIGKLVLCFKHESEAIDRRMAVVSEVMKVQDLSQAEILRVGKKIAMDPLETDYFFSLPEDYRRTYVLTLCLPDFQSGM